MEFTDFLWPKTPAFTRFYLLYLAFLSIWGSKKMPTRPCPAQKTGTGAGGGAKQDLKFVEGCQRITLVMLEA